MLTGPSDPSGPRRPPKVRNQENKEFIRGPRWSPPPMGFYIGILIKSSPPKGGVHKLMILLRDLPKEFLRKFFGEEMGGVRGTQTP